MKIFEVDCTSELEIKDIIKGDKLKDARIIYDKYAIIYNECSTEIEKKEHTKELIIWRGGYEEQAEKMNEGIESDLGTLIWEINHINDALWNKHFGDKKEKKRAYADLNSSAISEALDFVTTWMRSLFGSIKSKLTSGEEELKALEAAYDNLFEVLKVEEEVIKKHFCQLQDALRNCIRYSKIMGHVNSLSFMIREIPINDYPDTLEVYDELSSNEKEELLRGFTKSIPHLIREFADYKARYAKKYGADDYFEYIKYYQRFEGLPNQRAQAKKEASKKREKLKGVKGQTLEPWEKQWIKFRDSRTANR